MLHGYDLTDLSQSRALSDRSTSHPTLAEQTEAYWRDEELSQLRANVPFSSRFGEPAGQLEFVLAMAASAVIAGVWVYLVFT